MINLLQKCSTKLDTIGVRIDAMRYEYKLALASIIITCLVFLFLYTDDDVFMYSIFFYVLYTKQRRIHASILEYLKKHT